MKTISESITTYRESTIGHGLATEFGDFQKANKQHDRLMKSLHRLRQLDPEGSAALLSLLLDPDDSVRCWAATHSLRIAKARAETVLEQLAERPGIVGGNGRVVLTEWRKGTLEIP